MGKRFEAPFPIHRSYEDEYTGEAGISTSAKRGTVYGAWPATTTERKLLDILQGASPRVNTLMDAIMDSPREYEAFRERITPALQAAQVAAHIRRVRKIAWIAGRAQDFLAVDDIFILYANPSAAELARVAANNRALLEETRGTGTEASDGPVERIAAIGSSLDERFEIPVRNLTQFVLDLENRESVHPLCWHHVRHRELIRARGRGRPWTPARRIKTWAIYAISWIVGSEALALKVWNAMLLPSDLQWGTPKHDIGYARSKYSEAKRRLFEDVKRSLGPLGVTQQSYARPYPPLPERIAAALEARIRLETSFAVEEIVHRSSIRPSGDKGLLLLLGSVGDLSLVRDVEPAMAGSALA